MHLAAGVSVGLSGVAAGYTIGIVGDAVWILSDLFPGLQDDKRANSFLRASGRTCNNLESMWA